MELLDLLKANDVETFNNTRGTRVRIDLFAVELPDAKLAGVDLSGANIAKSDLTGADLSGAQLFSTDMNAIDGTGMILKDAIGHKVSLRGAYIDDADLSSVDFSRGRLEECVLTGSKLDRSRLTGCKLREADLSNTSMVGVELVEASLHQANLESADLRNADLSEASGAESKWAGARLEGAVATNARFPESVWTGANLQGAKFDGAILTNADLSGADLSAADLSRANLTGAKLEGAILKGANLADACLDEVDFTGIDLTGVDLTGLDPKTLGLSDEQIASLAAFGADIDPDAPLCFTEIAAATVEDSVAVLWLNQDNETAISVRWALITAGEPPDVGALPLSSDGILAHMVAPDGKGGFTLVLIQERPAGTSLVRIPLSRDGVTGAAVTELIGYDPAVRPSMQLRDDGLWIWGVARRGPTLVVHRVNDEGLELVHSSRQATARGIYGRYNPVLASKGGVVMPIKGGVVGKPLRTPDAFTGKLARAVPAGDQVLALWPHKRRNEDDPGGLRYAWLAVRGAPEPEILTVQDGVLQLDAISVGDSAWLAWVELAGLGASPTLHTLSMPNGKVADMPIPRGTDIEEICFAMQYGEGKPVIVATTVDAGLIAWRADGKALGFIGE